MTVIGKKNNKTPAAESNIGVFVSFNINKTRYATYERNLMPRYRFKVYNLELI